MRHLAGVYHPAGSSYELLRDLELNRWEIAAGGRGMCVKHHPLGPGTRLLGARSLCTVGLGESGLCCASILWYKQHLGDGDEFEGFLLR